jgi:hypothetical protein
MVFARYTKPTKVKVEVRISTAIYHYLEDLQRYYRIPLSEVIEGLICADHENIHLTKSLRRTSS